MIKPKIVLVEDETDIASLIKLHAEIAGYRISIAHDGLNGFELIQKEQPDLAILDIMLPGQSGLDVCRKVKAHTEMAHIPIIMLTAKSEETDIVLGLELGADDYVTKPFDPGDLVLRITKLCMRNKVKY